jgi:hypothetical protein
MTARRAVGAGCLGRTIMACMGGQSVRVATVLLVVASAWARADAGGVPPPRPPDWVTARLTPEMDVVEFIQQLPHDPNMLGVRTAHLRTKAFPAEFAPTRVIAPDGIPLAARWAPIHDGKPRPGVVLVPGTPQGKDKQFMVELATLFWRNGWHVMAIDQRGDGESRRLSPALSADGLKEWEDVLAAVRTLRSGAAATTVAVIGFSAGGVALVKAMGRDAAREIAAGIAVTAPIAPRASLTPPPPDYKPDPITKWFLDQYGVSSFYDYYQRAARMYGVDFETLTGEMRADREIVQARAPLLMLHTLDDILLEAQVKRGRHDGGHYSLAYRDAVKGHPFVRTLVLDRGNHAGMVYLSDPHWFGLATLSYLKRWQAPDADHVTTAVPPLDLLADGAVAGERATYRFVVRNHGARAVGPLDVHLDLPPGGRLDHCWLGSEGLGRCAKDRNRLTWTIPRLSGGKTTAGPFVAVVDTAGLTSGRFTASVAVTQGPPASEGAGAQEVTLEKP